MPQSDKQVKFYFGTQQEYNNLSLKDTCAIYFITDTKKIYVGEKMYAAPINIQDLNNLNLDSKYLSAFETNINYNMVPIITQNGQLVSSGKTIGTSVPENAYFITEEDMQTIQNILQSLTDLQVVGQAPPYYNNNGLMLYTDKEKLDRLPNSLSVATTETNGLMSAEDKEYLYSLGNIATYSFNNETYSYSSGLMTGEDKKLLDDLSDNVNDLLEFMSEVDGLIGLAEPSVNGEGGTDGLMSAEDKEKLNSLSNIEYTIATSNTNGLMSSTDKAKLDIYPILTAPYARYDSSTGVSSPGLMDAESIRHLTILWDNRNGGGGGGGSAIIDFEEAPRVSTTADGFMLKEDKAKLDNITGISNNTKFEFCTASEYNQMVNRTAAIYFILDDSTLLIKDANDNLLTLGNAGGNNNSNNLINSINIINQSSIGTYSNPLTESEMIQNNSGE